MKSDQPKPATDEQSIEDSAEVTAMKLHHITRDHEAETIAEATAPDQPTDEWTADYVADRFTIDASSAGQICDAHNAAISAWAKEHHLAYLDWEKQLSEEREKLEQEAKELELQLAAALKEAVMINALVSEQTKQLAAERSKVKELEQRLKL